jgi:hypothetical protein
MRKMNVIIRRVSEEDSSDYFRSQVAPRSFAAFLSSNYFRSQGAPWSLLILYFLIMFAPRSLPAPSLFLIT